MGYIPTIHEEDQSGPLLSDALLPHELPDDLVVMLDTEGYSVVDVVEDCLPDERDEASVGGVVNIQNARAATSVNEAKTAVAMLVHDNDRARAGVKTNPATLVDHCCGQAFRRARESAYCMYGSMAVCSGVMLLAGWKPGDKTKAPSVIFIVVGCISGCYIARLEHQSNCELNDLKNYITKQDPLPRWKQARDGALTCLGVITFFTNGLSAITSIMQIRTRPSTLNEFSDFLVSFPWFASWAMLMWSYVHTKPKDTQVLDYTIGARSSGGNLKKVQWEVWWPLNGDWKMVFSEALLFFAPAAKWASLPGGLVSLLEARAELHKKDRRWDFDQCWQNKYLKNALVLIGVYCYLALLVYFMNTLQVLGFSLRLLDARRDVVSCPLFLYELIVNVLLNFIMLLSEFDVVMKVSGLVKSTFLVAHMPDPEYFQQGVKYHLPAASESSQLQQEGEEQAEQKKVDECRAALKQVLGMGGEEESAKQKLKEAEEERDIVLCKAANQNVRDLLQNDMSAVSPLNYFCHVCGKDAPKRGEEDSESKCCWERCHRMESWKPVVETRLIADLTTTGRVMPYTKLKKIVGASLTDALWNQSEVVHELIPGKHDTELHKKTDGERRRVSTQAADLTFEGLTAIMKQEDGMNNLDEATVKFKWEANKEHIEVVAHKQERNIMCEVHYNGVKFLTAYNYFFWKTLRFFVYVSGGSVLMGLSVIITVWAVVLRFCDSGAPTALQAPAA